MIPMCEVAYVLSARPPMTPQGQSEAAMRGARGEIIYSDGWKTPGIVGEKRGDQVVICRDHEANTGGNCCGSVWFEVAVMELPSGIVVKTIGHRKGSAAYVPEDDKTPGLSDYETEDF